MAQEQVSKGEDYAITKLNRDYLGETKPVMTVDGETGDFSVKDADGNAVLAVDFESGVLSVNGQPAIGTTGTDLTLSGALVVAGASTLHAVSLSSGSDIVAAGGASDLDMSLSSGIFKTPTGQATLGGSVALASGKDIVFAGGASDLDMSLSSGIFKTPSGQTTLTGAVAVASGVDIVAAGGAADIDYSLSSGVLKTPTGVNTISGTVSILANKDVACVAGTTALDLSLGTGVTKTTTGLNTMGGDVLMATGKILGFGAPQALSGAGACNVTSLVTLFTSTGGAQALTLANGTQAGQLKLIHHTVDGGSGVLTPATVGNFATVTLTNLHEWALLQWSGSAWNVIAANPLAVIAP